MENRRIARSAFSISSVTFVSRVFGLVREWLRGYLLGTSGSSDAFTLAFMFPNLMRRLVGEGALMAAFIPVISEYIENRDKRELEDFLYSFFSILLVILLVITAAVVLAAPLLRFFLPQFTKVEGKIELTVLLTRIMFPYLLFISLAALSQGILNAHKIFIPSAVTPILLNISIIFFGLLAGNRFFDPAIALGVGVITGGVIQFFFQWPFLAKRGFSYRLHFNFHSQGVKRVFMLMVPGAIGAGVYQINALVSQFIAAFLEEGTVAALRFSLTLIELVLGIFVISLTTVILPVLSEKSAHDDREGMKDTLRYALRLMFVITMPAMAGLILLRYPIVTMLFRYGRFTADSASLVSYALLFHAAGLPGIGGNRVLVQMFYSMKDTKTPVYVAGASMIINLMLCYYLRYPLRIGGIALAGTVSSYCNLFLLVFLLRRRVGVIMDRTVYISLVKSSTAAAGMGAVILMLYMRLKSIMQMGRSYNAGTTLGLIVVGLFVYIAISILMKNRDITELKKIFR